ncbi:hypothetical protein N566_06185 [Streptomycetaceae bacterium MP113-05]|nr:hypothetical protein N566_06185 [Streptomycetaceae bacterium MP113-05]
MPDISEPQNLEFDDPVTELDVRVVAGAVNVVGADAPGARVEIAEIHGPPLTVRKEGGRLVIAYDDLPWKGFLKLLDRNGSQRSAVVTVSVPTGTRLTVGCVSARAVVSGVHGGTTVRGVSGGTTLVGLGGEVRADTVSGAVETQALRGPLRMNSVSGDLTVIDGDGSPVRADTVSGDMILDLAHVVDGTNVALSTVSGEIAVRLPDAADAAVQAATAGGALSSAFGELRVAGQWGARSLSGTLGAGSGRVRVNTVSGSLALLRRPVPEDAVPAGAAHDLRKEF